VEIPEALIPSFPGKLAGLGERDALPGCGGRLQGAQKEEGLIDAMGRHEIQVS
jgi:hypothetical protein